MRNLLLLICIFGMQLNILAQEQCGTMPALDRMMSEDPALEQRIADIEEHTQNAILQKNDNPAAFKSQGVITIPVVFHVVYGNATENISEEQLMSQLDVLNEDFRLLNSNVSSIPSEFQDRAADVEIEFCLAQRDPTGAPTDGILRYPTTQGNFGTDDGVKFANSGGADAWPYDQYMNFWVCDLTPGLLGYAQFPGGSPLTDGIVCDYLYTGRIGQIAGGTNGRTATHEVGHWLNLRHIWGDGDCGQDDLVGDTPNANGSTNGCPTKNTCVDSPVDENDMVQNYMDYSNDACMALFTEGQKDRMIPLFTGGGFRAGMVNSLACIPVDLADNDAQLIEILYPTETGITCNGEFNPAIEVRNFGNNTITSFTVQTNVDGYNVSTYDWTGTLEQFDFVEVVLPEVALSLTQHTLNIVIESVNGTNDGAQADNSLQLTFDVGNVTGQLPPVTEGFEDIFFPPSGFDLVNNDNDDFTWELESDVARTGTNSMSIQCYDYGLEGAYDDLDFPNVDLTSFGIADLEFYTAYARYSNNGSDTLEVLISTNCGVSFESVYKRWGVLLASADNTTDPFVPADNEWKKHTVGLDDYLWSDDAIIKIRCINGYENNMYVDDINIFGEEDVTSIENTFAEQINIQPNPANDFVQINLGNAISEVNSIQLLNAAGQTIQLVVFDQFENIQTLNLQQLEKGVYFIQINGAASTYTEKLLKL